MGDPVPSISPERVALAESFLQEAVYRSRGDQAGATLLSAGSASCGLGEKPSVTLDLSPQAERLFAELFPGSSVDLAALGEQMASWVKRQDALDRRRNHFLRDFRQVHGNDRQLYGDALLAEFEAGLAAINAEVTSARTEAARKLLEVAGGSAR